MTSESSKLDTYITVSQLAEKLSDILDRVEHRGERFVVQERGVAIATIAPIPPIPTVTVADIIARIGDLHMPGGGFADDLEAIQAEQGVAELPEWPD